jgi:hypothetical protein
MHNRKGPIKILFVTVAVICDVFCFYYDPHNKYRLLL